MATKPATNVALVAAVAVDVAWAAVDNEEVTDVAIEPATNIALVAAAAVDVARAAVDSEVVTDVATELATNVTLVAAAAIRTGVVTIEDATFVVVGRSNAVAAPRIGSLIRGCRWRPYRLDH